jgi:hypothetical protein
MPTIQKLFTLEIAPEKYVDSCTEVELREVVLLAEGRLGRMEVALQRGQEPLEAPAVAQEATPQPAAKIKGWRKWTAEGLEQLRTMSVAEAAAHFGCTPARVYNMRSYHHISERRAAAGTPANAAPPTPTPTRRGGRKKAEKPATADKHKQYTMAGALGGYNL